MNGSTLTLGLAAVLAAAGTLSRRGSRAAAFPHVPERAPKTAAFKRWFGDSKVVDGRGRPLVVFHGSKQPFEAFDYSRWGFTDPGCAGKGFYFIDGFSWAQAYADIDAKPGDRPTVIAAYLRMKNPLIVKEFEDIPGAAAGVPTMERAEEMQRRVRELGCDGVIVKGSPSEYIVFDPRQIKSTNNRGTFDLSDPRVSFNRSPP
jgi:hypothetical protein